MEETFKNGDTWTGYKYQEDNTWWFRARDTAGNEYDTIEVPATEPILTITQYMGRWTEDDYRREQANLDLSNQLNEQADD